MIERINRITGYKRLIVVLVIVAMLLGLVVNSYVVADEVDPINKSYQVVDGGGSNTSSDDMVSVSKVLSGTDYENIFDIDLMVQTKVNIEQLYVAQDTAVVIVMDISYSMLQNKLTDGTTRYAAALAAAEDFVTKFQAEAETSEVSSKVGYVGFNTDAHKIVDLTDCNTVAQRDSIISDINTESDAIMLASGYSSSYTRFTNIEAGLKMAKDMLADSNAINKYVIFLSDGFPTTYIKSGYKGYNPYMNSSQNSDYKTQSAGGIGSDGYFYNQKTKQLCTWGTSYSDKGATKAEVEAAALKQTTKVYGIGVGLADQEISSYQGYVVDCYPSNYDYGVAGQNYVVGNDTDGFKNWIKNKIASGMYWDSTDTTGLETAYDAIFQDIKITNEESIKNVWMATDPMSATAMSNVEFLNFYDINGNKVDGNLVNVGDTFTENTASVSENSEGIQTISWDLKNSVCVEEGTEESKTYTYRLKYRVRLDISRYDFEMGKDYKTNGTTFLTYQVDDNGVLSDPETLEFPIPVVKGYVGFLSFKKVSGEDYSMLEGAEFKLSHSSTCKVCNAVDNMESIDDLSAVSDVNGVVEFSNIPSGHEFELYEVVAPDGYGLSSEKFKVSVDYSDTSSNIKLVDGEAVVYNYYKSLILVKRIKASDINFDNGVPTFMFKVFGEDDNGDSVTYFKMVSFDKGYVENNTGSDGYVEKKVSIQGILDGNYTVVEEDSSRYILESITDVIGGGVSGGSVEFDLVNNDIGRAVYTNRVYENGGYSDTGIAINEIRNNQDSE